MLIKDLFLKPISRPMDGVIKVEKQEEKAVREEIEEYVITNELRKHFASFCDYFGSAFEQPVDATGVWISGHFGCGKSHLLKMLSYLLENKEVAGVRTVELFREKFADDPATFMTIERAARGNTEAILFDIDATGMNKKDDTVIMRIFAKKFYNHLGFYGNSLKIAMMEQFLDARGLTERFRKAFEAENGEPWTQARNRAAFFEDDIIKALMDVAGMSEKAAEHWFDSTSDEDEFSIEQLIADMKRFVDNKPADYRLLFMIDEVGQYIGENKSMLLNLQTILEKISESCNGKIWVVCTGQEALDKVIKARDNEFARILGRFKMRLSLSAASVDEVIKRRLLEKTPGATAALAEIYEKEAPNLKNIFAFAHTVKDIKGYGNVNEFVDSYPFAPYQFKVLQRVYDKAREHGNISIHTSSGARSMLSGFQESAKVVMDREQGLLIPFWMFYDTMQTSLDTTIRNVIARCEMAAANCDGIEEFDVKLLKLLFMVHYVSQDIPTIPDNLLVLMSDSIHVDRIALRDQIKASLERLHSQNYISRTGDSYNFLSDDEQEIQRGINRTDVSDSSITKKILDIIYGDIYQSRKLSLGGNNFAFDQYVDSQTNGSIGNELILKFLSDVSDEMDRGHERLLLETKCNAEAVIVLASTGYYRTIETALKVEAYCAGKNISAMPERMRAIIKAQQDEAEKLLNGENGARSQLEKAIVEGAYYVDGDRQNVTTGDAKARINQVLELLASRVYYELGLITTNARDDGDIRAILTGGADDGRMDGFQENMGAAAKMEQYIEIRSNQLMSTTMDDVQSTFKKKPYGWLEIDIACVMARLIYDQKVTVKYAGETIQPMDPRLPNMLRSKAEVGKLSIKKRQAIPEAQKRKALDFLRDYLNRMDIRRDEDGLIEDTVTFLTEKKAHYEQLLLRYGGDRGAYPGYAKLENAIDILNRILSQKADNTALIGRLNELSLDLEDSKEELSDVEEFFTTQVGVIASAARFCAELEPDVMALQRYDNAAGKALGQIRLILASEPFRYDRIRELNPLTAQDREAHDRMAAEKRTELAEVVRQCLAAIHTLAGAADAGDAIRRADEYYTREKDAISRMDCVALLNGKIISLTEYKDEACAQIAALQQPAAPRPERGSAPPASKKIKTVLRQTAFQPRRLETETQIDDYVESIRRSLKAMLFDCDGIQIK